MTSAEIRSLFLRFFGDRGHEVVPSCSLIPPDDPTLLLTTAGMVQFKPFFLRRVEPPYPRATSVQKCLRTTDVENVGHTARHLTFFEMLGNFSFGDYYKEGAIPRAWEFLTGKEWVGLDPSRFWITIFEDDDEAADIWRAQGVAHERIVRMGEKTNFWSAGPTGPCGPCSELLYDLGDQGVGEHECDLECECGRYLEIWNLVFMQYDRDEDGTLNPLEHRGIDTGMGLERLASVMQGKATNFETDLLWEVISAASAASGVRYAATSTSTVEGAKADPDDPNAANDVSLRIIADHTRAVTFMIGDGILPSNEGRGYVLRRLLRRAVRHGRRLGIQNDFLVGLCGIVMDRMGDAYPDLLTNRAYIESVVSAEERRFTETLRQGMNILAEAVSAARSQGAPALSGEAAFQLHDTFGFPLELTVEMAAEEGLTVDTDGFRALMEEQRARSSADVFYKGDSGLQALLPGLREALGGEVEFVGFDHMTSEAALTAVLLSAGDEIAPVTAAEEGSQVDLLFSPTPFYAESGGQVGDTGVVETETGRVRITETYAPIEGIRLHRGVVEAGRIEKGQTARCAVDEERRRGTMRNHTATHILQWALRSVLGDHVKQAGSFVSPERLRFDYTHPKAPGADQLRAVEKRVNDQVIANSEVRAYVTGIDHARELGATALFGEKYGKFVRVVETGDFSMELCGGTHAKATGDIGMLRIIGESSVGANMRRIEALTGAAAYEYVIHREDLLTAAASALGSRPEELSVRIGGLQSTVRELEKELKQTRSSDQAGAIDTLLASAEEVSGAPVVVAQVEAADFDELRSMVDLMRNKKGSGVFVLAAASDKVMIVAGATKDLIERGVRAGDVVKAAAEAVGGGGGGRPDMAQAGGKDMAKIPEALSAARAAIDRALLVG